MQQQIYPDWKKTGARALARHLFFRQFHSVAHYSFNATLYAYQAQKVTSNCRESIIQCLKQYDRDFNTPWDRSHTSLLTEWNSHMFFTPFDKSAQDIDFDNEEEGWTFIDYCRKAYKRATEKYFN